MDTKKPSPTPESASPRKRPTAPSRVVFAALGDGKFDDLSAGPPSEIFIEPTESDGEVAFWFDDFWWLECLQRWGDKEMVIHFLASPQALLNPVVLHQLVMIKRVAPKWRSAGYGYTAEVYSDADIEALARSAYDEVRLLDGSRHSQVDAQPNNTPGGIRIEDLFARVRRIQQQQGTAKPILVRALEIPALMGDTIKLSKATVEPQLDPTPEPPSLPTPSRPLAGKVSH